MKRLLGLLGLTAALACVALPARAQDDEAPAPTDSGPTPAERAARRAARKAELKAWHAKQRALREAKEKAAAEAAQAAETAVPAPPEPVPAAAPKAVLDSGIDATAIDTLPAIAPTEGAAAHGEHGAAGYQRHGAVSPFAKREAEADHLAETGVGVEGGHVSFKVGTFILQLVNFAVLLFILIRFGGRAFAQALRAKHEQLKAEIGEATRLRDEAQQKANAQERRLAELEKEIAAVRAAMRQDAEREQSRLLEAAQERGKKIQEEMRMQIDEQVKVAEAALRAEVANASVALAEEVVRKAVSFEDERRLAREFVAGFASSDGGGETR